MNRYSFILALRPYLLRKGFVSVLGRIPGVRIVREMESTALLMRELTSHPSAFLVLGENLLPDSEKIFQEHPDLPERTLVLRTGSELPPAFDACFSLAQDAGKAEIREAIEKLIQAGKGLRNPAEDELTPREQTIVKLVSLGMTNKQIAENLFLSTHTVITHRKNISSKLGIKSASGLTIYAIVNNLVTIEEASAKAGE